MAKKSSSGKNKLKEGYCIYSVLGRERDTVVKWIATSRTIPLEVFVSYFEYKNVLLRVFDH